MLAAMRRSILVLAAALVLTLPTACSSEEEPVANRYARQKAEIENKARALEAQVDNEVAATEARLQTEADTVLRNQPATAETNGAAADDR